MQTIGGTAREVGQFEAASELQDAIAGRLEAVHGEVPVHRMLQFRFVDGMGAAHRVALFLFGGGEGETSVLAEFDVRIVPLNNGRSVQAAHQQLHHLLELSLSFAEAGRQRGHSQSRSVPGGSGQRLGGLPGKTTTCSANMISQTKNWRIRSESNPQKWRTKGTHFWEVQKQQNSKAGTGLDKILFCILHLCWNLTMFRSGSANWR